MIKKQNQRLRVSTDVLDIIQEKYNVIDIIDFVDYDFYPEKLATVLEKYHSAEFSVNDRIVVLHHDTDYYPDLNSTGNTIYNFFRLCANFNIPTYFILFITNHYHIDEEIKTIEKNVCNTNNISVIYTAQWYDFPSDEDIKEASSLNNNNIDFQLLYSCLNGQQREHRLFTLCMLMEHGLLDQGIISYHFKG
jgi:hypothetical protein